MDKRLEQALDFSNFRMILTARQENLKMLMNNKLRLSYGGGMFKVDRELFSFVGMLLLNGLKETIILDENDIPIKIENLSEFAEEIIIKYESAMNQYYNNYQKLSEAREIRKVVDWDEEK